MLGFQFAPVPFPQLSLPFHLRLEHVVACLHGLNFGASCAFSAEWFQRLCVYGFMCLARCEVSVMASSQALRCTVAAPLLLWLSCRGRFHQVSTASPVGVSPASGDGGAWCTCFGHRCGCCWSCCWSCFLAVSSLSLSLPLLWLLLFMMFLRASCFFVQSRRLRKIRRTMCRKPLPRPTPGFRVCKRNGPASRILFVDVLRASWSSIMELCDFFVAHRDECCSAHKMCLQF